MEMVYGLRTKIVHDDDGRMHIGYGIEVLNGENAKVTVIEDVFLDMAEAVTFISLCNTVKLNPIHLTDVIEDMLE